MPKYNYKAVDLENNKISGKVEARDEADLRRILRSQNMVPIKYSVEEEKFTRYKLKANETAELSRQLASMLGSGITLVRALEIIQDRDFNKSLKLIYQKLYKDAQQGYTLSEAMRMQGRTFPELLLNMYASGEASGQLELVCNKMAVHYEKENRLNGKIKSAMMYPTVLFVVTVAVVLLIFAVILPQFFDLFKELELPLVTVIVMGISQFIQTNWYSVIIGSMCAVLACSYAIRINKIALKVDLIKLKLPVIGKLLKIIYTARFARTLSSLYSSGLSMLNTLEITATIIGNKYIESQFTEIIKDVRNGEPLSDAIARIDGFDKKLSTTILIGEESGRLDTMLESTAEAYDYEAEMATGRMVALIEPVMLVVMAIVIGTIMLAVMLPLMTLYQDISSM